MAQRSLYDLINGEFASGNPDLAEDAANPDAVIARQRFVYDFMTHGYNSFMLHRHNIAGTGSASITENGLELFTGSSSSNNVQIDHNNIRQFDQYGSRTIGCIRRVTPENCFMDGGFKNGYGDDNNHLAFLHIEEYSSIDGIFFQTNAAKSDTGISTDLHWHTYDIELTPASGILTLDGHISVTRTSDLPSAALQPALKLLTRTGAVAEGWATYMEAYNT